MRENARLLECTAARLLEFARSLRSRPSLGALLLVIFGVPALAVACKKTAVATRAQCEEIRAAAGASALAAASRAASSCVTAGDCVEIEHVSCDFGCSGYAVASSERARAVASIKKIDGEACKEWRDRDCAKIAPPPIASCASPTIACRKNGCTLRYPFEKPSADECSALAAEADKEIADAVAGPQACKKDDDCTSVSDHACYGGCSGIAVHVRSLPAYEAARKRVEAGQCAKWKDDDCLMTSGLAIPACMPLKTRCQPPKIRLPDAERYSGICTVVRDP